VLETFYKQKWVLLALFTILSLTAIACSSSPPAETPAPSNTQAPAPPPSSSQDSTATAVPAAPAPEGNASERTPQGELVVATGEVSFPALIPSQAGLLSADMMVWSGAYETPVYQNPEGEVEGRLAESWEISEDGTKYELKLREGIQFHGDWGEMTAEDWEWTADNQWYAPDTNRTNIHIAQAVDARPTATGQYTIEFNLSKPDPLFFFNNHFYSQSGGAILVASKKRHDALGDSAMSELPDGGTGPFRITDWIPNTELVTEAVPDHWRKTPAFQIVRHRQITEQATILAGLQTGEIHAAPIPVTLMAEVEATGLEMRSLGEGQFSAQIAGNYCIREWEGQPVPPRPAYDPSLAWIGDCDDPASMEMARKARWALSLSINRDAIVEGILGGQGRRLDFWDGQGAAGKLFKERTGSQDRWPMEFDLELARQYLQEAGFPDGFSIELVCVEGRHPLGVEICEAIGSQWEASGLGLRPQITRQVYNGGIRDRLVRREFAGIWSQGESGSPSIYYPLGDAARRPDAAFNPGTEMLAPLEFNDRALAAKGQDELDPILIEALDWIYENKFSFGVVAFDDFFAVNPENIADWPMTQVPEGNLLDFENVEPTE